MEKRTQRFAYVLKIVSVTDLLLFSDHLQQTEIEICVDNSDAVFSLNQFLHRYHQKVPVVPPNMNLQATHGLVDPTPYAVPSTSDKWTNLVYAGFSITKNVKDDKKVGSVFFFCP